MNYNNINKRIAVMLLAVSMLLTLPAFSFMSYATDDKGADVPAGEQQDIPAAENADAPKEDPAPAEEKADAPKENPAPAEEKADAPKENPAPAEEKADAPKEDSAPADKKADAPKEDPAPAEEGADEGVLEVSSPAGSYTVDFYFTAEDGTQSEYHLKGGTSIMLSELFEKLGINRNTADIKETVFTDNELVRFEKVGDDYKVISLKPFNTEESLTITFEDGEVVMMSVKDDKNRTPEGNINWNLDNRGTLTIRPTSTATYAGFETVRTSQAAWNSFWEYPRNSGTYIRSEVKKVIIKANNNDVPITLDKDKSHLSYMFSGFSNLESVEIEAGAFKDSTKNLGYMFYGCENLETVTGLENIDTTYTEQFQRMFSNCTSLEEVNLSSWKNEGYAHNMQNMFNGCTALETVKMPGDGFVVKENALLAGMFENCESLTTVDFGTADDHMDVTKAKTMTNMFKGCSALEELDVSTFGTLTNIVNMDHFVEGCTSLKTFNIDNLDNSRIGPTSNSGHTSSEPNASSTGASDFGRMLDIHTCTALETLSAQNSNVWMCNNNRGKPGSEYYLAANEDEIYYFTDKEMEFVPDVNTGLTVKIDSDRDYIDLITDRDGTNVPSTDPTQNPLPDATTNINIANGDLNKRGTVTNRAGMLAPGVYTLKTTGRKEPAEAPMCDTYYRITYIGERPFVISGLDDNDPDLVMVKGTDNTYINTKNREWNETGDVTIDRMDKPIKITYEKAAVDMNGMKYDVVIAITKITFKDVEKVPTEPNVKRKHDGNNYVPASREYYRPILQAHRNDGLQFHNYVWTGDPSEPWNKTNCLSKGSGTDIEFTISIDGAPDDTSFVFKGDDLDVPGSQNWNENPNDACLDKLPVGENIYSANGEGFDLLEGNVLSTLQFSEHTGLVLDGTHVMSTGSDPDTTWSEFTVKANAKGADYRWTSGISCTSYALRNTKAQNAGKISLQPKVVKELINGTLGADQFEFELKQVNKDPQSAPNPTNNDQTKTNAADGTVTFYLMKFGENEEYFPGTDSSTGEHNTYKYTYSVKEIIPDDAETVGSYKVKDGIIYDTSEHTVTIVIKTPENETEMIRGIKAEVYVDKTPGAGVTPDKVYWHREKTCVDCSNGTPTTIPADKWYDEAGNVIDDPNPFLLTNVKFNNIEVEPVNLKIPVEKILRGRPWKDDDNFAAALTLVATDTTTPMPEGTTTKDDLRYSEITINSQDTPGTTEGGRVIGYKDEFGEITYTIDDLLDGSGSGVTEKTFKYDVRELQPDSETSVPRIPGVTYDAKPDKVEVTVKLDTTDPAKPKLTSTVSYKDEDGETIQIPNFTNTYDAEQTIYKMEAVKDYHDVNKNQPVPLTGGEFSFILKPIGKYADIAPMPKGTSGTGAARKYVKENEDDGDIQFEVESDPEDGLVFNYQALLEAGISDEALHSDAGVDFEYEMYEVIPDGAVNNDNGTWSLVDDDGIETIYDGIHHTRMITVRVRTNDNDTPSDPSDDFDELYIVGHKDTHEADFFFDKNGEKKDANEENIPGYDPKRNHFKPDAEDLGAPIFLNYRFEQSFGIINIAKIWDDANDQDKIRPKDITISTEADAKEVKVDDVVIKGKEWTGAVKKLPVYKFNVETLGLDKITYTVKEKAVAGYTTSYDPEPAKFRFDRAHDYRVDLKISNKHTPGKGAAEGDETWGLKGKPQTGKPNYEVNPKNPVTPEKLIKPNVPGAKISDDGKTVTIPGEGKYILNSDGTITFTPEKDFVGDPTPIDVECKDKQGNTVTATYTPHVIDPTEEVEVKRIIKFTYERKDGKPVTDSLTQTGTITRKALEVDPKTGKVTKWGPWSTYTFPAVKNPDKEAGPEWSTKDIAGELTVSGPQKEVPIEYIIYHKKSEPSPEPDPDNPDKPDNPDNPKTSHKSVGTGDENLMRVWMGVILSSILIMAAVIRLRRRISENKNR